MCDESDGGAEYWHGSSIARERKEEGVCLSLLSVALLTANEEGF